HPNPPGDEETRLILSPIQHRKRRQQNVIIPKQKKPAENIDGFVSGLGRASKRGPFLFACFLLRALQRIAEDGDDIVEMGFFGDQRR
ncbi:hypothetical protein, partial [Agrobacterium salinitolerans]|uniref:hypothetical protein n=1 Tax=Agrobacterium salinitolerans TaxID=1183413 RepID=UPI00196B94D1